MKKLLFLLLLSISISVNSQSLKSSGIIVGIGKGIVSYSLPHNIADVPVPIDNNSSYFKSKIALEVGYKFRLQSNKSPFFYDIDLLGRYNRHEYAVNFLPDGMTTYAGSSGKENAFSFAVGGSVNYNIIKGLSVGVGVQPTYYIGGIQAFDIPIFAKIAYDLDYVQLAVSYQQGITKSYKVTPYKNIRLSQVLFSAYVPLFKRK